MALLLGSATLLLAGCKLPGGLHSSSSHFRFATVSEQEVAASLEHTARGVVAVLKEREISYNKPERNADAVRIWASKDDLEYVFDIRKKGDSKCHVRLEISKTGNEQTGWVLLREAQMIAEASG
jgi:hypothetical protein